MPDYFLHCLSLLKGSNENVALPSFCYDLQNQNALHAFKVQYIPMGMLVLRDCLAPAVYSGNMHVNLTPASS